MQFPLKHMRKTYGGRLPNIATFKAYCNQNKHIVPTAWITVYETIKTPESEDYFGHVAVGEFFNNHTKVIIKVYETTDFMLEKELSILKNLTRHTINNIVKLICHFPCSNQNKLTWNNEVARPRLLCNKDDGSNQLYFLVMEYIPTGHIGDYFAKHILPNDQFVSFVKQCLFCLLELFDRFGLHHGDLHHGNVLIDLDAPKLNTYKIRRKEYTLNTKGCEPVFIDFGRASRSTSRNKNSNSNTSSSNSNCSWIDIRKINWTFQEMLLLLQIIGNNTRDNSQKQWIGNIAKSIEIIETNQVCADYVDGLGLDNLL